MQIPSIHVGCGDFSLQRLEILCNENLFRPVACVDIDIEKAKKKIEISTNTSVQNLKDKVFKTITEAKKEYDVFLDKLTMKYDEIERKFINNFESNSILTRVEVFHHFVLKDIYSQGFYIMTLFLLFLIECIPFGIKIFGKQTSYEYLVNMKNDNTIDREKRKEEYHFEQLLKTRSFHNGNRVNENISSLQHSH